MQTAKQLINYNIKDEAAAQKMYNELKGKVKGKDKKVIDYIKKQEHNHYKLLKRMSKKY